MEIIVQGKGVEYFTPDEVVFELNFYVKDDTYEGALNKGLNSVQLFVNQILLPNGFKVEEMKTRSFVVREETKYDEETRNYLFDGYSYNQTATIKFDYNKELLAHLIEQTAKIENAPQCHIDFSVKNAKECQRKILAQAYQDAQLQAEAIAAAAGKSLKQCVKVDFKPFTTDYLSPSGFASDAMFSRAAVLGASSTIINTFTPEDIELSETLYCLWLAE